MILLVKVIPNSSRDAIIAWIGERLKIKVIAQPEKGQANIAVIKLLQMRLDLKTNHIKLLSGKTNSNKTIEIIGISRSRLCEILDLPLG